MAERVYPVIIQEGEDGKYVATCPAFEGCFSQGETPRQALDNIREAITLCLEEMRERGESVPSPATTFLTEVSV
jgi:predicted RNase H-like HicB family nuclease